MKDNEDELFRRKKQTNVGEITNHPATKISDIFSSVEENCNIVDKGYWKVLVVDDDADIHSITNLVLKDFIHENRKIQIIDTYSAEETKPILQNNKDIALILLDVVMESTYAGLDLVKFIRNEIKNQAIQIVLRTGQAGYAPEKEVITNYLINDYKTKTELTANKLFISVLSGIRSYKALMELESYNTELEFKIDERTKELKIKNKELEQLSLIASRTDNSVIITNPEGDVQWVNDGFTRIYGYSLDEFYLLKGKNLLEFTLNPDFNSKFVECLENKKSINYINNGNTKSGSELWVSTNLIPIQDEDGNIKSIIAIDTDISKTKKAEEEIAFLYEATIQSKNEIENQKEEIESQNRDIVDSINYAKLIQNSILPPIQKLNTIFPNNFIIYQPKDVVNGDFYYYAQVGDIHVIAIIDCTGHGVPGAFMSLIGYDNLNQIIYKEGIVTPSVILERLNNAIIFALGNESSSIMDGMDLSLCAIDMNKMELQFAGAANNLYLIRDKEKFLEKQYSDNEHVRILSDSNFSLLEIKGNRYGIGRDSRDIKTFQNHKIKIEDKDNIYLFSDGYYDQFGGENQKKYKINKLKSYLLSIQKLEMDTQCVALINELETWKGKNQQTDDITVIGIKLKNNTDFHEVNILDSDKIYLFPFIAELEKETIYDTGNIMNILNRISSPTKSIQNWKDLIIKAIYAFDENRYNELIICTKN